MICFRLKVFCQCGSQPQLHQSLERAICKSTGNQQAHTRTRNRIQHPTVRENGYSHNADPRRRTAVKPRRKNSQTIQTARFRDELIDPASHRRAPFGSKHNDRSVCAPPYLATFQQKFKQIKLSLINGNSSDIEKAVEEHRIDLGLIEGCSRQIHLHYTPFMQDELVCITSTRSRLAKLEEITIEELKRIPLVIREQGSGSLEVFEKALGTRQLKLSQLNIIMQLGTTEGYQTVFIQYRQRGDCFHTSRIIGNS